MRLFICHDLGRHSLDLPEGKTVAQIKAIIREKFRIRVDQVQLGDINFERNTLVLSYAGAELDDQWILSDMGIKPGSTLRAFVKEEIDPVLYLRVGYNEEMISILDRLKLRNYPVSALRSMASRRTGLPVGIFRMTSSSGQEMFDCHSLDDYGVRPGDVISIETWDGWTDLLRLSALGFTPHLLEKISSSDEVLAKFQMKVALYMAAHFGQVELSTTLTRQFGVRCDEAVGPHPLKQWCSINRHPDLFKTPIHEAVEAGQLSVLRSFVHHNVCSIMVRDGNGLQPLNLALRQKQKACASFLLTKQWSRIAYNNGSVPLAIFSRMKNWSDKARDKVAVVYGQEKSSLKRKQIKEAPLVGQGVYIDGFSKQQMNSSSRPSVARSQTVVAKTIDDYYNRLVSEPEQHFRQITMAMKLPKNKTKWAKMSGNKEQDDRDNNNNNKLPPLQQQQQQQQKQRAASRSATAAAASRPSSMKSAAPDGASKQQQQKEASGGSREAAAKPAAAAAAAAAKPVTASVLAKGSDSSIPLPIHSVDDTPRPFLHLKRGETNHVQQVLQNFYRHRGVGPRDHAIQCLSVAQNFREKPWLHQVRLAMAFTETGVRNITIRRSHNFFNSAN